MGVILGLLTSMVLLMPTPLWGAESAQAQLQKSAQFFDRGLYSEALKILSSLNIKTDLDNSDDMKLAFKIRSIAYSQKNQELEAREAIREMLFLDPDYHFDPFDTPKEVLHWASLEQKVIAEKNERLQALRSAPAAEATPSADFEAKIDSKLNLREKPPLITSLFPLGLNHFYLGSPVKGGLYLTLQSLSVAGNIGAYWWKRSYLQKFGSSRLEDPKYQRQFDRAQMIQYLAIGSAIAVYVASVIDALINSNFQNAEPLSPGPTVANN